MAPRSPYAPVLGVVALAAWAAGTVAALWLAPADSFMGQVQRIMYVHVPMVWAAFLAGALCCLASVIYLFVDRQKKWDRIAHASAELGVMFVALGIACGAIWGRPTWGVWWTWDARLTTTAILLLIYVGYLMVRSVGGDSERVARAAAVIGIVGFLDIPIIHMSVYWWRTLHQPPSLLRPGAPTMAPEMALTLLANALAYTLVLFYLLTLRTREMAYRSRPVEPDEATTSASVGAGVRAS
ncbi:MAG TPA: cytochrome c biogenesis protein CcsA [Thermodesulfobacteriota bacterium]